MPTPSSGFDVFPASESLLSRALAIGGAGLHQRDGEHESGPHPGPVRGAGTRGRREPCRRRPTPSHDLPVAVDDPGDEARRRRILERPGLAHRPPAARPPCSTRRLRARLLESLRGAAFDMPGYPDPLIVRTRGRAVSAAEAMWLTKSPCGWSLDRGASRHTRSTASTQHPDDEYIHSGTRNVTLGMSCIVGSFAYLRSDAVIRDAPERSGRSSVGFQSVCSPLPTLPVSSTDYLTPEPAPNVSQSLGLPDPCRA